MYSRLKQSQCTNKVATHQNREKKSTTTARIGVHWEFKTTDPKVNTKVSTTDILLGIESYKRLRSCKVSKVYVPAKNIDLHQSLTGKNCGRYKEPTSLNENEPSLQNAFSRNPQGNRFKSSPSIHQNDLPTHLS